MTSYTIYSPTAGSGWGVGGRIARSNDGNTLIAGARFSDTKGIESGCAYIFQRNGRNWIQVAALTPADGAAYDRYGVSVAISGDGKIAAVGAPYDDDKGGNSGSIYLYYVQPSTGSWVQLKKIVASDGTANAMFGHTVNLNYNGNTICVSARSNVYVFENDPQPWLLYNWIQQAKFQPQNFGLIESQSISNDGNTILIGTSSPNSSAYIYTRGGNVWTKTATLNPSDRVAGIYDYFGFRVCLNAEGTRAVISGPRNVTILSPIETMEQHSGKIYIFEKTNSSWTEGYIISNPQSIAADFFGRSLTISGDGTTLVAGAYASSQSDELGYAVVFKLDGGIWTVADVKSKGDLTSFAIDVNLPYDGDDILVSATEVTAPNGIQSGVIYAFGNYMISFIRKSGYISGG